MCLNGKLTRASVAFDLMAALVQAIRDVDEKFRLASIRSSNTQVGLHLHPEETCSLCTLRVALPSSPYRDACTNLASLAKNLEMTC